MATSPNFSWPEPDNTDLVKNGALAIRTAVDAIDSSMADLKGGTTGQVLSKNSNTDMDFTWVAQDDSNAIQNAIVDAKGDLIAATAADTPARLAVGTNGQVLTADSTTATGLKWAAASGGSPLTTKGDLYTYSTADARLAVGADYGFLQALASETTGNRWVSGAWTTYTPTVTAEAGSITSYTMNRAAYIRVGKLCVTQIHITITNKGTGSGALNITAPFNSYNDTGSGVGREIAVVGTMLYSAMGSNQFQIRKYDNTTVLVNNYQCALTIAYEVA